MDVAGGRVDEEEEEARRLEGHLTEGDVPVVGDEAGRRGLRAGEGVES